MVPALARLTRLAACLVALAIPAIGHGKPKPRRSLTYMLWDITSLGVDDEMSHVLRQMLESELSHLLGDEFRSALRGLDVRVQRQIEACGNTTECLGEAGGALGVDRVINGVVSVLGDAYSLHLKLIDARTARDIVRAKTTLAGDRAKMLGALQLLLFELIDPAQLSGALAIDVPIAGATVLVDGVDHGTTPLAGPVGDLRTGEHALKLTSPIIKDYFTFFTIYPGKTTTVRVEAEEVKALRAAFEAASVPLYKEWWFWTAAVAGVGAVAGAGAYYFARAGGSGLPQTSFGTIDMSGR